jgi:hypothetical protein
MSFQSKNIQNKRLAADASASKVEMGVNVVKHGCAEK